MGVVAFPPTFRSSPPSEALTQKKAQQAECDPRKYAKAQIPVPLNVAFSGNKALAD